MPGKSRSELVRSYFAAYHASDRAVMEAALTDDFTFTSPYDDAIDRATYFARWLAERQAVQVDHRREGLRGR